jgi:4-amino-4-deoxy-L-arabinose transferase-like glycosyltransferase
MLVAIGVAYIRGLFIPLMNNDSAHHANIALTMFETGDFVNLMDRGKDYLDKPHLLFWLSALAYKVFGVNAFAFRVPSFLFSTLAVHTTFKLATMLYSKRIGILSATILSISYGFFSR